MVNCLSTIYSMLGQLFSFALPWGITFGAVVVGVFGLPLMIKAFKKIF